MTEGGTAKRIDARITIDLSVSDGLLEGTCDPANCAELGKLLDEAHALHAQDRKLGAIEALSATVKFLKREGATEAQTLPLVWLLQDLTSKRTGNEKPAFDANRDGILASAIDILMESGVLEQKARKDVREATGNKLSMAQLLTLRKHIKQNIRGGDTRRAYDENLAMLRSLRETQYATVSARFWRDAVLQVVAQQFGLKKG